MGGSLKPQYQINQFRDAVDFCGFQDLGYSSSIFTWCSKRHSNDMIQERLDRFFCANNWGDLFPVSSVCHLQFWQSDHRPLTLQFGVSGSHSVRVNHPTWRRFFYEAYWDDQPLYQDYVTRC
ncbi:hypothetical protein ACOSP7_014585 [Xanthoceras sorbifolium]